MSSLADELLADFEEEEEEQQQSLTTTYHQLQALLQAQLHQQEEQDDLSTTAVESFSNLLKQGHAENIKLKTHMQQIQRFKNLPSAEQLGETEYEYIVQSNHLLIHIDHEIQNIFKKVRELYANKFPELESHVLNALDYARVVKKIGHQTDLSAVDMSDILPSSVIMIVRVTASTSSFRQSEAEDSNLKAIIDRALEGCDQILQLDEMKNEILKYVSSRMNALAPNLSAIVGTTIAAQLIGIAGGLEALSKIPSADLQLLGKVKKTQFLGTMSASTNNATDVKYLGYIANCDLINQTPPYLRKKIGRAIALKSTLAVRVDLCRSSPDGSAGRQFREQIEAKSRKLQEPPQGKQIKPLAAPDDGKKKTKRGGKKSRRVKEMLKLSEMQKKRNRLAFGTNAEEEFGQEYGSSSGFGMLGVDGSNSLRVQSKKVLKAAGATSGTKTSASGAGTTYSGAATQLRTGLASSLAFTPVQGIALENPLNAQKRLNPTNGNSADKKRYFSTTSFFKQPSGPPAKKAKTSDNTSS
jgi:U4/U6 small nuclear ribonucleoprotein PRP31